MTNRGSIFKSRDIALLTKVHLVKAMVFPVVMHGCKSWTIKNTEHCKNWCFWTVVLGKTLKSLLFQRTARDQTSPKGKKSSIFFGRTDAEAEAPMLWPPDAKNWFIGKDPDIGENQSQEEKGDEIVGWHHQLDEREFEQSLGVVMDREVCHAAVHEVTKSWTQLNWTENIMHTMCQALYSR